MALCYKIEFDKSFSIEELDKLQDQINAYLKKSNIILHDFNIEFWMDDQYLDENLRFIDPADKYNYLSGYFNVDKDGKRDYYLRLLKKKILEFVLKQDFDVVGVYVQDGQVIMDKNWVPIP